MANGDEKQQQGKINISLPFDTGPLADVFSGVPPMLQRPANNQLTPNIVDQPQINPSANFPEPPQAPAPPNAQAGLEDPLNDPLLAADDFGGGEESLEGIFNDPGRAELSKLLGQQFEQQSLQNQDTIAMLEGAVRRAEGKEPGTAAALGKSLANFSDAFFETDISKNIKNPETPQTREDRINALKLAVSKQKGALTKAQIDALKSGLSGGPTVANRLRAKSIQKREERGRKNRKIRTDELTARRRERLGDDAVKLGLPAANVVFNELEEVIPNGIEGYKDGHIPGVTGKDASLPTNLLGKDGKEVRSLALTLANTYIKSQSGLTVTDTERANIMAEIGVVQSVGEGGGPTLVFKGLPKGTDFVRGVRKLKDIINASEDILKASYGEEVFNEVAPLWKTNRSRRKAARDKKEAAQVVPDFDNMSLEELNAFNKNN